jgi:hypothetical protein
MLPYEGTHDPYATPYTIPERLPMSHDELRSEFEKLKQSLDYMHPNEQHFHYKNFMDKLAELHQYEKQREIENSEYIKNLSHHIDALHHNHLTEKRGYNEAFSHQQQRHTALLHHQEWLRKQKHAALEAHNFHPGESMHKREHGALGGMNYFDPRGHKTARVGEGYDFNDHFARSCLMSTNTGLFTHTPH